MSIHHIAVGVWIFHVEQSSNLIYFDFDEVWMTYYEQVKREFVQIFTGLSLIDFKIC